jgi:hypothetical protein
MDRIMTNNATPAFAGTPTADAANTKALLKVALPLMGPDGRIPWAKVVAALPADFPITYSRGWLIVRAAYIAAHQPELLSPMADLTAKALAKHGGNYDEVVHVLMPLVVAMRKQGLSWGEIMVRTNRTEGQVRRAFKAKAGMYDLGTRTGKGGRYLNDRGDLYQGNRAQEGAHIAGTVKHPRSVAVEELLNYQPPAATTEAAG